MGLKLYYFNFSAPARSSLLTVLALGLENEVEVKVVDITKGEQLAPEYLKVNPLHTVPTLVDDDFTLFESHAINTYLVDKYGKDDSLYPKDLQKRARVDQMLHYVNGIVHRRWRLVAFPILRKGAKSIDEEAKVGIHEVYTYLDQILSARKYMAGDSLTLADIHLGAWISITRILIPLDSSKYSKLHKWIEEIVQLPYFQQANQIGLDMLEKFIKTKLGS